MWVTSASERERAQRWGTYAQQLPAHKRGELVLVLLANAILTLALLAAWLLLCVRALLWLRSHDGERTRVLGTTARSPALRLVAAATIAHQLGRMIFARALDRRARSAVAIEETATHPR
jgi:hypothetical protein